ncbi:MAG: M56 family metallopeptidase [Planctomycetota bacterium]
MEEFFSLRLVNSFVAGAGDLCVLAFFFWLLRVRSPRLRRLLVGLSIAHCVSALFLVSPISVFAVQLLHDGNAPWYGDLAAVNLWVLAIWAGVAGFLLLRRLRSSARGVRLLRTLAELQPAVEPARYEALVRVADRLQIPVPKLVVLSGLPMTPFVVGLREPLLVVPQEFSETLDDDEWAAVVVHELMHLRHYDTWRSLALEVVRTLLFFNLPLQLLVRRYRQELEKSRDLEACAVLGARRSLASGLVKVSARVLRPGAVPANCAAYSTFLLPRPHQTVDRLRALAWRGGRWQRLALALQIATLVVVLPWQPTVARNPVCLAYHPAAGGEAQHSTILVSAGMTTNPVSRWVVNALVSH